MKKELDLSGLKLVFGGLIIQLISVLFTGRLATGLMTGTAVSGIVPFVIRAASLCIILAGVAKLGNASPFFIKARKPFLVQLLISVLMIVILVVLGSRQWSVNSITQTQRSSVIEILIGLLVILVVSVAASLISVRTMLRGCGHVAEQVNDPLFSIKCLKTWRLWYMSYLITILMFMAGLAMIVTVLRKTMESGAAGEDLTQAIFTNVSSSVLLVSIIVMAVLIFFLIVHIMYMSRIRATYREYHLETIENTETGVQRPVLADYVQRELEEASESALYEDEEETEESWDAEETDHEETEETETDAEDGIRQISGRKYRRITEEPEEEPDPEDMLEIAKLFKRNRK